MSLKLIAASEEVRFQVMAELCHNILDGVGMQDEQTLSKVDNLIRKVM